MNIENRITALEGEIRKQLSEAVVVFTAKTETEFERQVDEYLETHPEPDMFIHIVEF